MTSSTKSSNGKLLGITGNEETGNVIPKIGMKVISFSLKLSFLNYY